MLDKRLVLRIIWYMLRILWYFIEIHPADPNVEGSGRKQQQMLNTYNQALASFDELCRQQHYSRQDIES